VTAIRADAELVAYCGLYCGACRSYLADRCRGCHENARAAWCKIRSCCIERRVTSCAACAEFDDPRQCRKFDNIVAKLFGLLFRSDRAACITQIKQLGLEGHAAAMAAARRQSIRR
jgi:hypothetical protein